MFSQVRMLYKLYLFVFILYFITPGFFFLFHNKRVKLISPTSGPIFDVLYSMSAGRLRLSNRYRSAVFYLKKKEENPPWESWYIGNVTPATNNYEIDVNCLVFNDLKWNRNYLKFPGWQVLIRPISVIIGKVVNSKSL